MTIIFNFLSLFLLGIGMALFSNGKKVSAVLPSALSEKVNSLPRDFNMSVFLRWAIMGLVYSPQEIAEHCWQNQEEANQVGDVLRQAFSRIYEGQKISDQKERAKAQEQTK